MNTNNMINIKALLLWLSMSWAVTATSDVLMIADTGFIIENKIQVAAPRETVWAAFVEEVDQWWPADHTWWGANSTLSIEASAGGCFCEKNGGRSAEHMRITFVDPHELLRMTGGLGPLQGMGMYGALEWTFVATDQGTEVTMTYRVNGINQGGLAELAPIVDQVQDIQLRGLQEFVTKVSL